MSILSGAETTNKLAEVLGHKKGIESAAISLKTALAERDQKLADIEALVTASAEFSEDQKALIVTAIGEVRDFKAALIQTVYDELKAT